MNNLFALIMILFSCFASADQGEFIEFSNDLPQLDLNQLNKQVFEMSFEDSEVTIGKTKRYNLILRPESCENLMNQRDAICRWKQNLDSNFEFTVSNEGQCRKESQVYRIIISQCLPKFTK